MGSACRSGDWRQAVDSRLQVSLSLLGGDSYTVCQWFERLLYSYVSRKSVEAFVPRCRPVLVLSTSFCARATAQRLLHTLVSPSSCSGTVGRLLCSCLLPGLGFHLKCVSQTHSSCTHLVFSVLFATNAPHGCHLKMNVPCSYDARTEL